MQSTACPATRRAPLAFIVALPGIHIDGKASLGEHIADVHAPAKWRVNGPLSNLPAFYDAFEVKPGQPLYRAAADRVHIW